MAGAISGTTIAAIMAMVAGSAMQYKAQQDAAKRQEAATRESLARQSGFQQQAERKAMDTANEFTTDKRMADQSQIETNLTQEFIKPVENAQQINSAQSTTQGNVSNDYTAAKAGRELETMKTAAALARILGKTTSAGRLRSNESIRVADAASGIDRLGSFSRGQAGADQIGIQAAGRPNAGLTLGGSLLTAAGGAALAGGSIGKLFGAGGASAGTGATATASTAAGAGAPIAAGGGGVGFTGIGGAGLRVPRILGVF